MTPGLPRGLRRSVSVSANLTLRVLVPHDPADGCDRPVWVLADHPDRFDLRDAAGRRGRAGRVWMHFGCVWVKCPAHAVVMVEPVALAIPKEAFP